MAQCEGRDSGKDLGGGTLNRREAIAVTLATTYINNYVRIWNLSDKESYSDHKH